MHMTELKRITKVQQTVMQEAKDKFDREMYLEAERTLKQAQLAHFETQKNCNHNWVGLGSWGPRDWEECTKCGRVRDY